MLEGQIEKYYIEMFPENGNGRGSCGTGCGHCPFADQDVSGEPLTFTDEMLASSEALQRLFMSEENPFNVNVGGLTTRLTQIPRTNEWCDGIMLTIGPLDQTPLYDTLHAALPLIRSNGTPVGERAQTLLILTGTDEEGLLALDPNRATDILDEYLWSYAEHAEQIAELGFVQQLRLGIGWNTTTEETYAELSRLQGNIHGVFQEVKSRYAGILGVESDDISTRTELWDYVYPDYKLLMGRHALLVPVGEDAGEHTNVLQIDLRYMTNNSGGFSEGETLMPRGVGLYPHGVLFGHNSFMINTKKRWTDYDTLGGLILQARSEERPFHEIVAENFS